MKKIIFFIIPLVFYTSCGKGLTVKVENTTDIARVYETIEVPWQDIADKLGRDIVPAEIVVERKGRQIASQVIYNGGAEPLSVIFQADVDSGGKAEYRIKQGIREDYEIQAYGRIVPERKDDFAWENNIMAYRVYGPALEATGEISNGIDVWLKSTEEMVIDKWYLPGYNYHKDQGEGLDCYKVGRTLGAGAMAPYADNKLWLGNNFVSYKVLDNGPIRISFELEYAPFFVDTVLVSEKRIISCEANSHFNRIAEVFTGDFNELPVAAGIVLRRNKEGVTLGQMLGIQGDMICATGYWEPQNMDNNMDNGHTGIGLVFDREVNVLESAGHLLASTFIKNNEPLTYLAGAAWSKRDMPDAAQWSDAIYNESIKFKHPLKVMMK